ncbi:MAG: metallophosphoesterase family protein [Thermoplasmata archaeon]
MSLRLAFISDVHSNLPAFLRFIEIAKIEKIEEIYCAGDLVGYNPFPCEIIERFIEKKIVSVAGNHDIGVRTGHFGNFNADAEFAGKWTREQLNMEHIAYLKTLPEKITIEKCGKKICICHGSPDDPDEYIYPWMADETLLKIANADILVLGHTHVPFKFAPKEGRIIFNPGSIGQPRDGDWRASFAILECEGTQCKVIHKRFEYPVNEVIEKFRQTELPETLAARLLKGW